MLSQNTGSLSSKKQTRKTDTVYFLEFSKNNSSFLFLVHFCVCFFFFKTPKDLPYETHVGIIMFKPHFIK